MVDVKKLGRLFWLLPFGRVPEIGPEELATLCSSGVPAQLIDVRTQREWRKSHIPDAENVPITSLRKRLPDLELDRDRPVVAICLSGHRSIPAVRLLRRHGFEHARHLRGGMKAWWSARLPTESLS